MDGFITNGNITISSAHIRSIMSVASVISIYSSVESYTVVSDMTLDSFVKFQKIASKYKVKMNLKTDESFQGTKMTYLVLKDEFFDYSKIVESGPKLIISIFFTQERNPEPPEYLTEVVISPLVSFFVVHLSENPAGFTCWTSSCLVTGRCTILYKPFASIPVKAVTLMFYGSENNNKPNWTWDNEKINWNYFSKEIRNMTGINITVVIASYRERKVAVDIFLKGKTSFFWKNMAEYLNFNMKIQYEKISAQGGKSVSSVYIKLLRMGADGLGILPVMSSDRNNFLDYIVTGLDSKFQIMVRTPQFVYSWHSIFKPFTTESWICLGLVICLLTISLKIVTYKKNLEAMDFSGCFLTIFGFVSCQGSANIPKASSPRIVCYTALLFSFSIYQFYTSNFYSLLSTKEATLPFTSLEQFLEKHTHSLYVHPDTAIYSYILNAKNGSFKRLWDEFLKKDPKHQLRSNTRVEAFSKVCRGTGAILGLPFQTTSVKELTCKLVAVNSGYFPTNIVTVVRKRFPFKPQFEYVHLRLLEGGLSHKFRDEKLEGGIKHQTKTNVINEPVSLEHVAFLLVFYAAAIAVSFMVLGFELIAARSLPKSGKTKIIGPKIQVKKVSLLV